MDGLWNGLEKAGLRPDRLMLEWCSAAEGARWQTIMDEVEKKRLSVDIEEIDRTRSVLEQAKIPRPRNPKPADENTEAGFVCLRCDYCWNDIYHTEMERTCPQCRSNSIRWLKRAMGD
jgi:hypothetical protein